MRNKEKGVRLINTLHLFYSSFLKKGQIFICIETLYLKIEARSVDNV